MKAIAERLRGSIVPVVTPFTDENTVDYDALVRQINWVISEGSHGISVTGTTGEPAALSMKEREDIFRATVNTVAGRVPVLLATGSSNLEDTLRLTATADILGADAVLVIVPYYNRPSQEGLYQFFTTVARSTERPLVIYNIPGRTATNIEPETVKRIVTRASNVVGIKESNRDFEQVTRVLHLMGSDFLVFSGIESLCFPMLALGGAGHISATANILPRAVADLYDLAEAGEWQKARELHYYLYPLNEALFWETNPGPLKAALGLMGKMRPHLRLPLAPISEAHFHAMRNLLARYGVLSEVGD